MKNNQEKPTYQPKGKLEDELGKNIWKNLHYRHYILLDNLLSKQLSDQLNHQSQHQFWAIGLGYKK